MPAIGDISVTDAAAAAHVFSPVTTNGTVAKFANRVAAVPMGFETLSIELRNPSAPTGAYRLLIKANDPVLATVDGNEKVVRNCSADFALNFSQLSTPQERKDLLEIMSNLLSHADGVEVAADCEPIY
jgi:hypothetical protein